MHADWLCIKKKGKGGGEVASSEMVWPEPLGLDLDWARAVREAWMALWPCNASQ